MPTMLIRIVGAAILKFEFFVDTFDSISLRDTVDNFKVSLKKKWE